MSEGQEAGCAAVLMVVVGIALCCLAFFVGDRMIRNDALHNGAAHYEVDPQTGDTKFVWDGARKVEKE